MLQNRFFLLENPVVNFSSFELNDLNLINLFQMYETDKIRGGLCHRFPRVLCTAIAHCVCILIQCIKKSTIDFIYIFF